MKEVAVVGEGAWGTAVALLLANNGLRVNLWCHDAQVAQAIREKRRNERYFPSFVIPENIQPVTDFSCLERLTYIFEAIPVRYMRSVFTQMKPYITDKQRVVILSKGIEQDFLLFPAELVNDVAGMDLAQAVLAGPSFAHDLAAQSMTAVSLASETDCGVSVQKLLNNDYFHADLVTDMIGVQVSAALKNVISLGIGIAEGASLSDNTKALVATRGLQEMGILSEALGGSRETVYGLSGVGDLFLSSVSSQGRNASLGRQLGQGARLADLKKTNSVLPESVNTLAALHQLIAKHNLNVPLCAGIYKVVYEGMGAADITKSLFSWLG